MRTVKLLTLILLVQASSVASADRRNPLTGQPAIRNRIELRKLRFEISPQFMVLTNPDYKHAFGGGGNLQFHITDWLGIGVQGAYFANANTALEDKVHSQLPPPGTYVSPGPQPDQKIHDAHVMGINAIMSAYASLTPFTGKFAMFSAVFLNYDLYLDAGVGFVNYVQNNCCKDIVQTTKVPDPNLEDASQFAGLKVGAMVGFGVHLFINDWFGIQLQFRDYIVRANPGGSDVNGDRHLTSDDEGPQNNLFFGIGATFMLPPKAKITH
jgi:outer membrane beta-barrel protein